MFPTSRWIMHILYIDQWLSGWYNSSCLVSGPVLFWWILQSLIWGKYVSFIQMTTKDLHDPCADICGIYCSLGIQSSVHHNYHHLFGYQVCAVLDTQKFCRFSTPGTSVFQVGVHCPHTWRHIISCYTSSNRLLSDHRVIYYYHYHYYYCLFNQTKQYITNSTSRKG